MPMPRAQQEQEHEQEQAQEPEQQVAPEVKITDLWEQLYASKGSKFLGLFSTDSGYYQDVISSISKLVTLMNTDIRPHNYAEIRKLANRDFGAALNALDTYLAERKGHRRSDSGNARKALVRAIRKVVVRDFDAFNRISVKDVAELGRDGIGLMDLISFKSRTEHIDLSGKNLGGAGEGSSSRLVFEHEGKGYYFTKEEALKNPDEAVHDMIAGIDNDLLQAALKKMYGTLRALNDVDDLKGDNGWQAAKQRYGALMAAAGYTPSDKEWETVAGLCVSISAMKKGYANNTNAGMKDGDVVSNRNAGMSRVAELLGIDGLLAKSTKATVIGPDGKMQKGNLMEDVGKVSANDIEGNDLAKVNPEMFTGEIQRQLMSLQLLDILCGQIDRHGGNYILDMEKDEQGKITGFKGIKGIDNDMAFANMENADEIDGFHNFRGLNTKKGGNGVPLVDKELGEKLLALTGDQLVYALGDIITKPEQQQAMLVRLEKIKEHLRALKKQETDDPTGKTKTFLDKGDWNNDSLKTLTSELGKSGTAKDNQGNYVGELVMQMGIKRNMHDMGVKHFLEATWGVRGHKGLWEEDKKEQTPA